jgi:hypothetical protein
MTRVTEHANLLRLQAFISTFYLLERNLGILLSSGMPRRVV